MQNKYFATGSRKTATAKVWMTAGKGDILVNRRPARDYFGRADLTELVITPLRVAGLVGQYDVDCRVRGGGTSAQAGAVALGIARALANANPDLRKPLKGAGLLRRDPREKERMKYGLAKRRKRFQWTKR
ncbi:MAG: 30S ribosomal protein S9 [candidate division WOR-3 bacterium]